MTTFLVERGIIERGERGGDGQPERVAGGNHLDRRHARLRPSQAAWSQSE